MQNVNTVIFDLGGVLVDWQPARLYRKIFDTEEEVQWFLNEICTHDWNAQQDAGRTIEEANQLLIAQHPDKEHHIRAYYDRWEEMFGPNIEGSVKILEQLVNNENYRVLALTNWSAETWPIALRLFPFFSWFEGVLVSGEEGMKKPDQRIYARLCEKFGVEKASALFFDDSHKNVEAAVNFGLNAFQFKSPEQLQKSLADYNIQVSL